MHLQIKYGCINHKAANDHQGDSLGRRFSLIMAFARYFGCGGVPTKRSDVGFPWFGWIVDEPLGLIGRPTADQNSVKKQRPATTSCELGCRVADNSAARHT